MTRPRITANASANVIVLDNTQTQPIKNIFGTDGIRGTVGNQPFTVEDCMRFGYTFGAWVHERYGNNASIILADDTRISSAVLKSALHAGLLLHPLRVHDAQVLPTPMVYYLTRVTGRYDCGIIISASHNPFHDNGIKIVDSKCGKLNTEDELKLSALFSSMNTAQASYNDLGTLTIDPQAWQAYYDYIHASFPADFLRGRLIVLDCAHGATSQFAPAIFSSFGARVISINNQPTGYNINEQCGAVHTKSLEEAVIQYKADAGFAFDGDGDRVIAVNRYGERKDGDDILALLIKHPAYTQTSAVVGTVMSNRGFEVYLERMGKHLLRANVGDKYVAQQLEHHNLILGGEQSGHIIIRDFLESGDGTATALKILETLIVTDNWDMRSFDRYPQILINIPVLHKRDLADPHLARIIQNEKQRLISGRTLIRYSGTEALLRIMVEDENLELAQTIATNLATALGTALNS